jgi:signal transduction histidine kinase/CheY-like chemotaxis protein
MHLDVITLRFSESAIALLLALLSAALWFTRRMYAGFGFWTLAKLVGTASFALSVVYGNRIEIAVLMAVAGLGSVLLSLEACRSFFELPPRKYFSAIALAVHLFLLVYAGAVLRSPALILLEALLVAGVFNGLIAWLLFRRTLPGAKLGRATTAFSFTVLAVAYITTALRFVFIYNGALGAQVTTPAFAAITQLALIAANFGFFLMHYERLLRDREEEAARTAVLNRDLNELKDHLEDTVQKKTAELIRSQKLESIGRLAGGMAHDFNNLLAVMHGHANLVQAKMPVANPLRSHIDKIVNVCEEAGSLTEGLLAFGRQQSIKPSAILINEVVHKLDSLLRDVVGDKIELATRLEPSLGYTLADRGQLRQVLINLVLNARDAMPEGGDLTISTRNVDLDEPLKSDIPAGSYVMLTVTDTGHGMDEETRSHIFEPFFTTKESSKRTGLGLATVYGIVKQSGGHLQVETQRFEGTTFRVFLPRLPKQAVPKTVPELSASNGGNILVVEDYKELRALIGEVLREAGYSVIEASTGPEALGLLRHYQGRLDLVMTDLAMPEMDGQTFAEHVRLEYPDLKIVFMSAYPEAVLEHAETKQDGIRVLRKPFTDEDLTAQVREVLKPA